MSWVSKAVGKLTGGAIGDQPDPPFVPGGHPSSIPSSTPAPFSPMPPDSQTSSIQYDYGYANPNSPPPKRDGGSWFWDAAKGFWGFIKDNAGDILSTAGSAAEAYMSSEDRAKALAEQARQYDESLKQRQAEYDRTLAEQQAARAQSGSQFERTTGDSEAQAAVRAQTQLNAAPIADKAQALALSRLGVSPGQFKPRDYTAGTNDLSRKFTAPGAPVANAMQQAASSYQPGQGGIDTSALKMLLAKMTGNAQPPQPTQPALPALPPGARPRPLPTVPTGTAFPPPVAPPQTRVHTALPHSTLPARPDGADQEPDNDPDDPRSALLRRMGAYA